jgi:ZIP family zinc transporter
MNNAHIIILSLIAGAATFLGVWLGSRHNYGEKTAAFGASFAATIMLLISGVELIPASISDGGLVKSGIFVIIGVLIIALANYVVPHLHAFHDIKNCDQKCMLRASYLIAIGLVLHDFPEGFAIPASFGSSASLGAVVIISSFLHNIPEGYAMTVASRGIKGGFCYKSAAFSTLASFSGAILGIVLINYFTHINAIFLAVAAGAMLYISFHELIPMALKHKEKTAMLWGAAVALILFFLLGLI